MLVEEMSNGSDRRSVEPGCPVHVLVAQASEVCCDFDELLALRGSDLSADADRPIPQRVVVEADIKASAQYEVGDFVSPGMKAVERIEAEAREARHPIRGGLARARCTINQSRLLQVVVPPGKKVNRRKRVDHCLLVEHPFDVEAVAHLRGDRQESRNERRGIGTEGYVARHSQGGEYFTSSFEFEADGCSVNLSNTSDQIHLVPLLT